MRDRRALFFFVAALVSLALVPASDNNLRWVPEVVAAAYGVLTILALLDALGRGGGPAGD